MTSTCKIRYTKGPEELSFGHLSLLRDQWSGPVDMATASECLRPGHIESYGFEADGYTTPSCPETQPVPTQAADPKGGTPQPTAKPSNTTSTSTKKD